MNASELDTPAVTIDLDVVDRNIRRVQEQLDAFGVANRPHIKTHKIPWLAERQRAAGAKGITCQKIGEAEVFADAGFDDIMLTFNILGDAKTERLAALARRLKKLTVVLDNDVVARGLSEAGKRHDVDFRFLIECDTGFHRNGVQTPQEALDLAQAALTMPRLQFDGLMTYPKGNLDKQRDFFQRSVQLFGGAGIPLPVISSGGSATVPNVGELPMVTEHRAGTYIYNDRMMVAAGVATWDDCAMRIRATVVSRPTDDRAILDTGSKVLTADLGGLTGYGRIVEYPDAVIDRLSEEHGMVDLSRAVERPKIGEIVHIIPNHTCVVTNMFDEVYAVREGKVEAVMPVAARGKVR
ncbi:D-TA family PLP-dependent enzyme [Variibacter gotjawalensis]|uniref:D-TA family PLP-dependent enzyme n=1 Tax=Variibacter gotjawalensis TaxID=1333996 RepID=UPI000BBA56C3|nr:D-TA family PLP-dependent enzyme [Variibacter gotjawalensis]